MASLFDMDVYSFRKDEAYDYYKDYVIRDINKNTDHSIYVSRIFINIDLIKIAYNMNNELVILQNGGDFGAVIQISKIFLTDGSVIYTSREEFDRLYIWVASKSDSAQVPIRDY